MAAVGRFRRRVSVRVTRPTFALHRMAGMYLTPLISARIQKIVNMSDDCSGSVWLSHVNWTHINFHVVDTHGHVDGG